MILHCYVTKLELEAVAGVRAPQASGQVESPQWTRAAVISQCTESSARCRNGETFALNSQSDGTSPSYGWGWRSYDFLGLFLHRGTPQ